MLPCSLHGSSVSPQSCLVHTHTSCTERSSVEAPEDSLLRALWPKSEDFSATGALALTSWTDTNVVNIIQNGGLEESYDPCQGK